MKRACSSPRILLLLLLAAAPALADGSTLVLRDARTGLAVAGQATLAPVAPSTPSTSDGISTALSDSPDTRTVRVDARVSVEFDGPQALRVEAPGYRPLSTVLRPTRGNAGWSLLLDPVDPLPTSEPPAPGRLIVEGWIHDSDSFQPVGEARVRVEGRPAVAISDARGRFALEIEAPKAERGRPVPLEIRVERAGYPPKTLGGLLTGPGRLVLQIGLGERGRATEVHRQNLSNPVFPPAEPIGRRALGAPVRADQPPQSITVGFADAGCSQSCCTGNCGFACVMSLEEYVRRGIDNEWIASWSHDALAAGAVAYRSYGAWHVLNPPTSTTYDLCSSACCQVNNASTNASTDAAAAATAGLMLIREGAVFRSEYSAQNNCLQGDLSCSNGDLSCGDGFAGSPATGWPCLADPVSAGRDCFGHGRGMSQWGNHYWTLESPPRRWKWQLDHYYNDNGSGTGLRTAGISQVLSIDSVTAVDEPVAPGQRVDLTLMAENLAAAEHADVLIGASLRRGTDPFIDDPANDRRVTLPAGVSATGRPFDLPATAAPGSYDLWLALWIDVDRDGAVTSTDLVQDLVVIDSAVQVGSRVFEDRFEE